MAISSQSNLYHSHSPHNSEIIGIPYNFPMSTFNNKKVNAQEQIYSIKHSVSTEALTQHAIVNGTGNWRNWTNKDVSN